MRTTVERAGVVLATIAVADHGQRQQPVAALARLDVDFTFVVDEKEVLRLPSGESLKERLSREGELPIADAARILRDVVDALSAAHAAGVVHRDIKPANVRILPDGTVKIMDFGIAKTANSDAITGAGAPSTLPTLGVP